MIAKERKEYIKEVFDNEASIIVADVWAKIDRMKWKYQCMKPEKIENYLLKSIKNKGIRANIE